MQSLLRSVSLFFIMIIASCNSQYHEIEQIVKIPYDVTGGISTIKGVTGRYAASLFEIPGDFEVAFICDVDKLIKIYNTETGELVNSFEIKPYIPHLHSSAYSRKRDLFYFFDGRYIYVYSKDGEFKQKIDYYEGYLPNVGDIIAFGDNLYIRGFGETYPIIGNGINTLADQLNNVKRGNILNENVYAVFPGKIGGQEFSTIRLKINDKKYIFKIPLQENTTGMIPKHYYSGLIVFLEYLKVYNSNYNFKQNLIIYSLEQKKILSTIKLPLIRATNVSKDFVFHEGNLYHYLSTKDSAIIFKLPYYDLIQNGITNIKYPDQYLNYEYIYHGE